jgi:Cu-Zn family superoxide dismutase
MVHKIDLNCHVQLTIDNRDDIISNFLNLTQIIMLKRSNYLIAALVTLAFVSCKNDTTTLNAISTIMAKNSSGISGTVSFIETDGIVSMVAKISGLTPKDHAIHIHAVGDCSANDGTSAGGHWNPTNVDHGIWGTAPFHIGDIGNIESGEKGTGTINRETDLWCINCNDETRNIIGKAIIIHEGPDDFTSQPSGAAGDRIGCGEIVFQ